MAVCQNPATVDGFAQELRGGYLTLTGDGVVHPFGKATFYGSAVGKLPKGVSAVSLTLDPKTAGY